MSIGAASGQNARLTFEERVAAQAAIERVYYSHQIDATLPFSEVVPLVVLERKVRRSLEESVMLERYWGVRVTSQALHRELERMARDTRFPARLKQIYDALNHDPVLVAECFARPILVRRLLERFYAGDDRLHEAARQQAEQLHRDLQAGRLSPFSSRPDRAEVEWVRGPGGHEGPEEINRTRRQLNPEEFDRLLEESREEAVRVLPMRERADAFTIDVLLERSQTWAQVATYRVPKRSLHEWKQTTTVSDEEIERIEVATRRPLPDPSRESTASSCLPDDVWDNGILGALPEPRSRHAAVWTGNEMIVWGGGSGPIDGSRYDPLTDSWVGMSTTGAPSERRDHTAVWTGSEMIVWGGIDIMGPTTYLGDGARYDPAADSWSPVSATGAPTARHQHAAEWTGTLMLVWGGRSSGFLGDGARYDPASDTWSPISTVDAPTARAEHSSVWAVPSGPANRRRMVIWGGRSLVTSAHNDGGRYDPVGDVWEPMSMVGVPQGRYAHTAVWSGSEMIVWGGAQASLTGGGRYNLRDDVWSPVSTAADPTSRSGHTSVWTGNEMIIWGGSQAPGGRYDPATDTWAPVSTVNEPLFKVDHSAVWTGSQMVIWGGDTNTGGRYDPTTDTWTPTSTANAPEARSGQSTVWTGSLMLVWGGAADTGRLATGGRYDPMTDSWSSTATAGAPAARTSHSTVWTGREMIVWGGLGSALLANGGRYDPMSDSWTAVAPFSSRVGHSAIWTGDRMIVWGGSNAGYLQTGGSYDPRTDHWTSLSTTGAPEPRGGHNAVWTGSLMLIWGGGSNAFAPPGGRYDPVDDTWSPMEGTNDPWGFSSPAAAWTGSELIVWGGRHLGSPPTNLGGRYDPLTDTWTPMNVVDAPSGRWEHAAVWTGRDFIVWGGIDGDSQYSPDDARYDPATDSWTPVTSLGAPRKRVFPSSVWTGGFMIVWGGVGGSFTAEKLNTGGRYALRQQDDLDEDAFSFCDGDCNDLDPLVFPGAIEACDGLDTDCDGSLPADEQDEDGDGSFGCDGDCDPTNGNTFPGAAEVNDGEDNQCPGEPGFGAVDEVSGLSGFFDPSDSSVFSWPGQAGATLYETLRSSQPDFGGDCVGVMTSGVSWVDASLPPSAGAFFYLVRPMTPWLGSWGTDGAGAARLATCQ